MSFKTKLKIISSYYGVLFLITNFYYLMMDLTNYYILKIKVLDVYSMLYLNIYILLITIIFSIVSYYKFDMENFMINVNFIFLLNLIIIVLYLYIAILNQYGKKENKHVFRKITYYHTILILIQLYLYKKADQYIYRYFDTLVQFYIINGRFRQAEPQLRRFIAGPEAARRQVLGESSLRITVNNPDLERQVI